MRPRYTRKARTSKDFALCLSADGLLRTDEASTNLPWYPLEGNTRTALRTDEGGWRGVCSSHGHVTLLARGSLPKSQAQAQVHNKTTSIGRLLAGRLLPPCSLAGTVTTTSEAAATGRFEIVINNINDGLYIVDCAAFMLSVNLLTGQQGTRKTTRRRAAM